MASPFRVFRKHQKKLLAALGILAIVAFCVPIGFIDYIRHPSVAGQVVVRTSKHGDIADRELRLLLVQRQQVLNFLDRVQQAVIQAKREANLRASEGNQVPLSARAAQLAEQMIGPATEEAVVNTWLYAQRAKQRGLVVSNQAINDFIREVSEDCLESSQVTKIIHTIGSSPQQFFERLRHELLAVELRMMFNVSVSLASTTPAQRWEYYARLKRTATIEAIPVPVVDYVSKVKDPPPDVLRQFFEQYKDNYPDPLSPEPGFRKPHEIVVRYFKADLEKFMAPKVITDDQVKKFYEENKELIDRLAPLAAKKAEAEETGKAPGEKPGETSPAAKKESNKGQPPAAKPEATPEQKAEKRPSEKPAAETTEQVAPKKAAAPGSPAGPEAAVEKGKKSAEKPATEAKKTPEKETSEKEKQSSGGAPGEGAKKADPPAVQPESGGVSSSGAASPFRLTSFGQEPTDQPGKAPAAVPPEEAPKPPSEAGTPRGEPAKPPLGPEQPTTKAEPAEPVKPTGQTQPTEKEPVAKEKPAGPPAEKPAKPPEKTPAGQKKEAQDLLAGPIGEMIRRQLAHQKIQEIFGRLQGEMNRYRNEWVRYDVDRLSDPSAKRPEEPDFEALARKDDPTGEQGLTTAETPWISQWDVQEEASGIGQSFVDLGTTRIPFVNYAFREKWDLYVAAQSSAIGQDYQERSRYLFWKVKDSKEKVLEFDDPGVREKVLRAWKMVEARKLAIKAAENLGDQARKAGLSLSNTFIERPDINVIVAGPFSWMTYGNVPQGTPRTPPRLSQVKGVEMAGPDFMRAVFGMKKGQIGVAMNHPKTIAYVVRVNEINPPQKVLWAQFEVDNYGDYAEVAADDQGRMFRAWQEELQEEAGLEWVRPPRSGQGD
jgi:hypothetical protein